MNFNDFGEWYHRIEIEPGVFTPGIRNQGLVYNLYKDRLPQDLTGMRVLDLGANACGLSVEFAKRGAKVVAIEHHARYVKQGRFVIDALKLEDAIELHQGDLFSAREHGEFDIVCYVGLAYHIRHPQLALDMLGGMCRKHFIASSQTDPGDRLVMRNRAADAKQRKVGELWGWNPTERLFIEMIGHAGFTNAVLVSTHPHPGETKGNVLSNRSYFYAEAGEGVLLPFVDDEFNAKPRLKYLPKGRNFKNLFGRSS
ncbi:MAG: methyltransferase domain-containing protein [Parvularculaceae bacterium]